ncbi:MAG: UDP-2,3-diacylglucosamine diphosphatase [candidate division WOR-3 bacterium]|nr:MAG: UDP-2,3-diacylglucosamine diphosphatase [candidate division WOR-3 bacterium]
MHLFISDAHISNEKNRSSRMLVRFLEEMRLHLTDLYIIGDLFEIWFDYDLVFPKGYFHILASLRSILSEGKEIHYVMGNHEIAIGDFLHDSGIIVHRGPAVFDVDGWRVLLSHGHKVDKRPWTAIWNFLLTSKVNHRLYRMLHPDIGIALAQRIALLSRKQRPSSKLLNMLEDYARRQLHDVDIVILGHSHLPELKAYAGNKYYINAGDWVTNFSYVLIDNERVSLEYYGRRPIGAH